MMVHEPWGRGGGTGVTYVVEHSTGTLCTRHVFPTGDRANIHTEKKTTAYGAVAWPQEHFTGPVGHKFIPRYGIIQHFEISGLVKVIPWFCSAWLLNLS